MFYSEVKNQITRAFRYVEYVATQRKLGYDPRTVLGQNLRALAEVRQWSSYDIARASGASQKTVNNAMGGRSSCTNETGEKIAAAFGLHYWQLLLPDLRVEDITSPSLPKLVKSWARANESGKLHIVNVAEREAHYSKLPSEKD